MADRDSILNEFRDDSLFPNVNQIVFSEVQARNAMDEYMKATCYELLEYMAKHNVRIAFNSDNQPIFRYKENWISKEQLFENFL